MEVADNLLSEDQKTQLHEQLVDACRLVFDPEIPVNIYDLGLIYDIIVDDEAQVDVKMTLTTPACPVAQTFPATVEAELRNVIGVQNVTVEIVWDPPWTQDMMTDEAKLQLGLF